MGRWR